MSSGWTLDDILELSIGQIACALECVMTYKAEQLDLVLDIASQALGGKKKGKSRASKGRRKEKQKDQKHKEQAFLHNIANSGLSITDA
jgi:hypothetical protein